MAIPDYQTLMRPILLESARGEIWAGDLAERLSEQLGLTPEERTELLPSGKATVFINRVYWAKTYLSKVGLLDSRRGYFKATPRKLEVIAANPARIDNNFLNQFEDFKRFKEKCYWSQWRSHIDLG